MATYKKMDKWEIELWILLTISEIETLTNHLGIPHNYSDKNDERLDQTFPAMQIRFPWCKGDVVVGLLHVDDDMVIDGQMDILNHPYPSIETYQFPWDGADITVFSNPVNFVKALEKYYIDIKHNNEASYEEYAKFIYDLEYGDDDDDNDEEEDS